MVLTPPCRLDDLITTLEAGKPITKEMVRRAEQLQALDLVKFGRDIAIEAIEQEQREIDELAKREQEKRDVISPR